MSIQCDLERCIRSVAVWQKDDVASYVRWFADSTANSIVARVCQSLLAQGVQSCDCATFAAEWEWAALALGKPQSVFLPHHFKTAARNRYGTSGRVNAAGQRVRVAKTAYPPFVLADGFLSLNPVVREAVRLVAEERRESIVMLKNYL